MAGGNRRIVQDDFSAGSFIGSSFEQIPSNGVSNAVNYLVGDDRTLRARGGSRWAAPALGVGASMPWMWSGVIGTTKRTIVASDIGDVHSLDDLAGTISGALGSGIAPTAPGVTLAGLLIAPGGLTVSPTLTISSAAINRNLYAVAGNRLWAANVGSTRVDFSDVGAPNTFGATSFHEIPEGGILGMVGLRDSIAVFTDAGVWIISNVGMQLTDAAGNVQHHIDRYSRSLVLWHANGLGAAYEGSLVVPARDGVYLLSYGVASEAPQQFTLISRPIGDWYRQFVTQGYVPGQPTVFRNTLFLPLHHNVLGGHELLVCRLDATDPSGRLTFPWTRILSFGSQPLSLARSVHTGNLLAGVKSSPRVAKLDYFDPSLSTVDSDGEGYFKQLASRSPVSNVDLVTLLKFRLGYLLTGTGTLTAQYYASDAGFVALPGSAADNTASQDSHLWRIGQRARYSTVETLYSGQANPLLVRSMEWFVRDRGRV